MFRQSFSLLAALFLTAWPALAQTPPPVAPAVAATVNGTPVYETAVQRFLAQRGVPADKRAQARAIILDYLIDNVLIDQYLQQLQVTVDSKDVDKKVTDGRAELKLTAPEEWAKWLQSMQMTEAEVNQEATADMRWHKYAYGVATDKVLREFFDANKEIFDGTQVHARHIFLAPPANDAAAGDKAVADLRACKQQIEQKVADDLKKLPAETTPLKREEARRQLLVDAFAAAAKEKSMCPSREEGGDLHFFPRVGDNVEEFSKAAFALKLFEISDVVHTPFGYHLILVTDRTQPRDVKFDDPNVKNTVFQVYCDKLRDAMVKQAREKSKIEIAPSKP